MENDTRKYRGHGYRKFFTVTDISTGEKFCTLCQVNDQSIYKRLRQLIQADIEKNSDIIEDILQPKPKKEKPKSQPVTDTSKENVEGDIVSLLYDESPEDSKTDTQEKSQVNTVNAVKKEEIKADAKQDEEYDPMSDPKFPELVKMAFEQSYKKYFPDLYKD